MYFNTDKITMYYEKYGASKNVIIILPGWGNTRPTFDYMINYFKDKYTIYIFDYPSFGKSKIPDYDLTIYDYALYISRFIEENNITNPILIAHSFGGRIAALLTGYYKENISKQVLIDIAGIKPRKTLVQLLKQFTYKLLKKLTIILPNKIKLAARTKLLKLFGSKDLNDLPKAMLKTFKNIINEDLSEHLKSITCESLLIWGKLDKDTPIKDGLKIKKSINNSEIIIYEQASHFPYLEYPILTNRIIEEFIKK